jgi:pimeloyl-ACP methyl ester carboxylesterase
MSKTTAGELAQRANQRSARKDIGTTAGWWFEGDSKTPLIILIHGFRGDHHGLSLIAASITKYDVLVPDLPGYGKTPMLQGDHDLENYANWLIELVSKIDREVIVLGHSFGSLIVATALSKGLSAKAIVLENPITTKSLDQKDLANRLARFFYKTTSKLGSLGSVLLRGPAMVRGMSMVMATSKNRKLRSFIHTQHSNYFSNYQHDRVAHEGFLAASSGNVLEHASAFRMPTLLIVGEKDSIAPLAKQIELQKQIPGSTLEVMPKVGHLTHYETPTEVAALIESFVDSL